MLNLKKFEFIKTKEEDKLHDEQQLSRKQPTWKIDSHIKQKLLGRS